MRDRNRPAILLILAILVAWDVAPAVAQSGIVRGFVTEAETGEPLVGVNVVLRRDSLIVAGVATRADGFFALSGLASGTYRLEITFIGFTPSISTIRLGPGGNKVVNVALSPSLENLDEVLVEAERGSGAAQARAGRITIRTTDVLAVPSPAIGGDLVGYLTTLPGIVTIGDRGGQLFVRGGEPWQNLVLLDGMWVYQPFHVLGFFSSFPAEILGRVNLYAGGFGSRYGGSLSSVIDVEARTGSKRNLRGTVGLSPFVSGVTMEGPLQGDRMSFLVSLRESNLGYGADQLVTGSLPYRFGDLFVKVHSIVSASSQLSISLLSTHDRGTIGEGTIGRVPPGIQGRPADELRWRNLAAGLRYVVLPGSFPVLAEFLFSVSRLRNELGEPGAPARSGLVSNIHSGVNVTHFSGPLEVEWGLFARTIEMKSELTGQFQSPTFDHEWLTEAGLFFEPRYTFPGGPTVSGGFRVQAYPSRSKTFFEPRLRAEWRRGPGTWSAAGGVYHQEIVGLSDRRDAASVFTVWAAVPYREVPRAIHVILGYSRSLAKGVDLGVEGYHKWLSDLFVPEWTAYPRFTTRLQPARGSVSGADVRLEVRRPDWYLSATYGLNAVRYEALQESLELWFGEPSIEYRPGHDRRHQVNLVVGRRIAGIDLNAHWQFGSGLPFSRAQGFDGYVHMDGPVDVFEDPGSRRVIYDRPFDGLLPTYHRLDVTASRSFDRPWGSVKAQVGVINAYDRRNLFYLDTFTLTRTDQLPFIPTLGLQFSFQ